MIASVEYIERKFDEFNRTIFGGKLPKIPIQLSNARTFVGLCVFKRRRTLWGKTECYDFRLRISTRLDLPEQEVEDTIIHEMIHYYIGVNQMKDTSAHGTLFRRMMDDINRKFGRHITISHKTTDEQKAAATDRRPRWHVIAVVAFHDGRTGLKVLPRVVPSILKYYNNVLANSNVADIQLYMSNDIFFNRFPCSSALRAHFPDRDEMMTHLRGAEKMVCDGKRILRGRT